MIGIDTFPKSYRFSIEGSAKASFGLFLPFLILKRPHVLRWSWLLGQVCSDFKLHFFIFYAAFFTQERSNPF